MGASVWHLCWLQLYGTHISGFHEGCGRIRRTPEKLSRVKLFRFQFLTRKVQFTFHATCIGMPKNVSRFIASHIIKNFTNSLVGTFFRKYNRNS